jgi:hypothetical protein
MARLAAVLKATASALWRERRSALSVAANNFFVTVVFFFREYTVGVLFYLLLAAVLLFPLSSDPIHRIPRERLQLWPLSESERWLLRVLAPWLNPITWLMAALLLWAGFDRDIKTGALAAVLLLAIALLAPFAPQGGRSSVWKAVPRFPTVIGQFVRKDIRQMLSTLDFWLAAFLSGAFSIYRLLGRDVPAEAATMFSLLVVLALSTVTQTLFALDGNHGRTRYHLMPLAGSQVIAAKATAWLCVLAVLTAPLSLPVGVAAGLVTLAFGCFASVKDGRSRRRWRFASSPAPWNSVGLVIALLVVGVAVFRESRWWMALPAVAAVVAVGLSGRRFDVSG